MSIQFEKATFGRHESFGLRYGWLTKGYQGLKNDPKIFESDDATVRLGVGKNMVDSIRYWLKACRIVEPQSLKVTAIGDALLGREGFDPYLEDEATIWLLHWLLATNYETATAWYWFFNAFHKPVFAATEAQNALADFVKEKVPSTRVATTTIKADIQLILRMYTQSKGGLQTPIEEALDSPFSLLRLITKSEQFRTFESQQDSRPQLPLGILGFALSEVFELCAVKALPIKDLMYFKNEHPAPGALFRLTEADLLTRIEQLIYWFPGVFEIRETAGIHQVYQLKAKNSLEFINKHYKDSRHGVAA